MKTFVKAYPKVNKSELARKLGVSRSMLYYRHKRPEIDEEVKRQIESVLTDNPAYGHKRIALELKLNKKRILRVMKKFGIKPYRRRVKKPVKKDDLGKPPSRFKNEIKRFCPILSNIVWVTDFTYVKYQSKFIYVATMMDLFTREMIGINISRFHNRQLVLGALINAAHKTKTLPKYLHSDQGSEYGSQDYIVYAKSHGVAISMSHKASPWENGHKESYYSGFKLDLGNVNRFEEIGELIENIYLTVYYYNNQRIHTSLKTTPVNFRRRFERQLYTN